jgi:hypothetical protein
MNFTGNISFDGNNNNTSKSGNRYGGGSASTSSHPYVKGYFYVFFGFPSQIFNASGNNVSAGMNPTASQNYLLSSAESFTPPGDRTLTMGDVQGQGGVAASFITGQTITREFSIQYKDYFGAPIFRIHKQWTSYLNPYLGASTIASDFTPNEYKGVCMVIQTKPVARSSDESLTSGMGIWKESDIVKVSFFDGVVPMTDLSSAYDANITDNSFVKPTVQYKFDGFPLDETDDIVLTKAQEILNSASLYDESVKVYSKLSEHTGIANGNATN